MEVLFSGLYISILDEHECQKRLYFPQVALKSKTTLNASFYTTNLQQTFFNPSDEVQKNVKYVFPLYDGVVITSFECFIGEKHIIGQVKQRQDAKKVFENATERGETAGLIEQLPAGLFGVSVGNIPAKSNTRVTLNYAGEIKLDGEISGIRFTIPVSICPRYGELPDDELMQFDKSRVTQRGIQIDVDMCVAPLNIKKTWTPIKEYEHLLVQNLVTNQTTTTSDSTTIKSSSVTLNLLEAEMQQDFVLLLELDKYAGSVASYTSDGITQTTMISYIPDFKFKLQKTEIVFVADQSGSMQGPSNISLVDALKIFLKSLPINIIFNLCAFGSDYTFAFPESVPYTKSNLQKAIDFVDQFNTDLGGTELQKPIERIFKIHNKRSPLDIILLTDGQIWQEQKLFDFIHDQIDKQKVDARVFCLGIGDDVSHTLVEGLARAGRGISQIVTPNENLDGKVVRMLKCALTSHISDVQIDFNHFDDDEDDEGVMGGDKSSSGQTFSSQERLDTANPVSSPSRFISAPIINLFPFERTNIYVTSPLPFVPPTSITIRAKTGDTIMKSKISITKVDNYFRELQALATRKLLLVTENGQDTWICQYKSEKNGRLTDAIENDEHFENFKEKTCVEFAVHAGIMSKYTSFVAVGVAQDFDQATEDEPETYNGLLLACPPPAPVAAPGGSLMSMPIGGGLMTRSRQGLIGTTAGMRSRAGTEIASRDDCDETSYATDFADSAPQYRMVIDPVIASSDSEQEPVLSDEKLVRVIINNQQFDGSWQYNPVVSEMLKFDENTHSLVDFKDTAFFTCIILTLLKSRMQNLKEVWEMCAEKAESWLEDNVTRERHEELVVKSNKVVEVMAK